MPCVYAREVTKLTYLLLKLNDPNPNHVPHNDTISLLLVRLLVRTTTVNNNKIRLVRSFIRALLTVSNSGATSFSSLFILLTISYNRNKFSAGSFCIHFFRS